ncbi:MAG: hypothetical protein KDC44_10160 [Phaeodactylibacter sp.]|nr:hypothetical protein [Phaeodactylibacter sp.]
MYKYFFLLIPFFAALPQAQSQQLLTDVNRLMLAMDTLKTHRSKPPDSAVIAAAAEVLSILYHYDQGISPSTGPLEPWDIVYARYQNNPLIRQLIPDSLILFPDTIMHQIEAEADRQIRKLAQAPRQKILKLLHQKETADPADYFSVQNSLVQYQSPPISQQKMLRSIAENANPQVQNGLLTTEAAIITGLFEFILERAKDEVLINFLDGLLNKKAPELRLLFPTVNEEFSGQTITNSSSLIERLRSAFYEDLQMMSVRLPRLMLADDYFGALQGDPVAFNFLALYSMLGLAQQEQLGLEDIVPMTHRFIYDTYSEREKEVNFLIAETCADSADYQILVGQSRQVVDQIKAIFQDFSTIQSNLIRGVQRSKARHCRDSANCPPPPLAKDFLDFQVYSLQQLISSEDQETGFSLMLLPSLLAGKMDSAQAVQFNLLKDYDRFFAHPHNPVQWKSAGLELAKRLSDPWYEDLSILQILSHWQSDLKRYEIAVRQWQAAIDPAGALAREDSLANVALQKLRRLIQDSKNFWAGKARPNFDPNLAFINLLSIAQASNLQLKVELDLKDQGVPISEISARLPQAMLKAKDQLHFELHERLVQLDKALYDMNPDMNRASPVQKSLAGDQQTDPLSFTKTKIQTLGKLLARVKQQVYRLEHNPGRIQQVAKIRDNAKPILELTELLSQLMYGLYTGGTDQHWISLNQLDTLMDGGMRETAFLGLLQQRLDKVNGVGLLAPNGLAQLTRLTIQDLTQLSPDHLVKADSMKFYYKAALAINTMNRLMEIPLVVEADSSTRIVPLINLKKNLRGLPQASTQTLDFVYFIQKKDHQHAISSFIRLLTDLSRIMEDNEKELANTRVASGPEIPKKDLKKVEKAKETSDDRRQAAINFLKQYGDFIADLVDARTADQVKNLLESIADPPGGSRAKRTSAITVGLNAYLGGNVGSEKWLNTSEGIDESFISPGVNMPVGIAFSFSFKKKNKPRRASYSIFASFLDLGGLFTYVPSTNLQIDNTLSFKNILKPGLQLHWNIPKSPFYLGVGGQYGTHYQTINEQQIPIRATRFFMSFGVDVPIKMFYQR